MWKVFHFLYITGNIEKVELFALDDEMDFDVTTSPVIQYLKEKLVQAYGGSCYKRKAVYCLKSELLWNSHLSKTDQMSPYIIEVGVLLYTYICTRILRKN